MLDFAAMRTAIRNTTIVTCDAGRTVHHDATLVVEDDRIAAIDLTNRMADRQFAEAPAARPPPSAPC